MRNTDLTDIILDDLDIQKKTKFNLRLFILIILIILSYMAISFYIKNSKDNLSSTVDEIVISSTVKETAPIIKETVIVSENKINVLGEYFIQVSAFRSNRKLSSSFVKKFNDNNFNIIIREDGKFNKVLIGPYLTSIDATEDLSKVRKNLTSDAFIKRYSK